MSKSFYVNPCAGLILHIKEVMWVTVTAAFRQANDRTGSVETPRQQNFKYLYALTPVSRIVKLFLTLPSMTAIAGSCGLSNFSFHKLA